MEEQTKKPENKSDLPVEGDSKNDELTIKQNPNPRANANLTEDQKKDNKSNETGVGSEITDGEGG